MKSLLVQSGDTGGEILGKEHPEKTGKGSRNGKTRCGKLNCPSDSKVLEEELNEKGSQCCPTLQKADSREVICWSGRPTESYINREARTRKKPGVGITIPVKCLWMYTKVRHANPIASSST